MKRPVMPWEFRWMLLDSLRVDGGDEGYQRDLGMRASAFVAIWDWALYDPVLVGKRVSGEFYVMDGQARTAAIRTMGYQEIFCRVLLDRTDRQSESALYDRQDVGRKGLTQYDHFKAAFVAGKPYARAIATALGQHGLVVTKRKQVGGVPAIVALRWIYERGGESLLDRVMFVIVRRWGTDQQAAWHHPMLKGIGFLLLDVPKEEDKAVIRGLRRKTPDDILSAAQAMGRPFSGFKFPFVAQVIASCAGIAWAPPKIKGKRLPFRERTGKRGAGGLSTPPLPSLPLAAQKRNGGD